jgi:hypothetical protein
MKSPKPKRPSEETPLISFRVSPNDYKFLLELGKKTDVVGTPLGASRVAREILLEALKLKK